jgi:plastocyanin
MKAASYSFRILAIVSTILTCHIFLAKGPPYAKQPPPAPASIPASQSSASVKIENFAFEPKELDVAVGATVTWQNADDVPHTATSRGDPQVFDSGPLDTDDTFSFTFSKPGKFTYYCKVHPHMTGVIVVK